MNNKEYLFDSRWKQVDFLADLFVKKGFTYLIILNVL